MRRWRILAAGTVLAATTAIAGVSSASPAHIASGAHGDVVLMHSADGITVRSVKVIDARQLSVTIVPKALARPINVRILLPIDYQPHADEPYPVLYLFPGTSGHSSDWMTVGDAPKTTAPYRLITVSSDIGFDGDGGSWFTDWVDQKTALGPSQWETYDIHELIPWVDANLDTIRSRQGRAVAGLSMGGYGATELAARHPDLFVQQAAFSGAPEIDRDLEARLGAEAVIGATMVGLNGVEANAPFGNHISDEINWEGHDPARLITNLRPIKLWFATANGLPGQYDDPVTNPGGYVSSGTIESLTHISTDLFVKHLKEAHMTAYVYDYGRGTHTWPYWARDFKKFIPTLMATFAHPPATPKRTSYLTINPQWSQWGWTVRIKRPEALAFAKISRADDTGFDLGGEGTATVVTPRYTEPGATNAVTISNDKQTVVSDQQGRLHLTVQLGTKASKVAVRFREIEAGHG
ncbi:MAG TPA: alpha/beta hydrolase family protein [Mycobacteriales bacterium]|jgi:S-formylglutathione hydrolase FrmB|nr:alpha/beta hydrolase family protein [Mycobacteriales bacterium]